MSKIIKHTFEIPNLVVKDGELVEQDSLKKTYTFTLLFKGIGLYEEITGEPLFKALLSSMDENGDKIKSAVNIIDKKFIKDLAAVSYVKIEGDKFHNNRATVEEFKKSQVYRLIEQDLQFTTELMSMAMECIYDEKKSKANSNEAIRSKK